jgi:hypothetical protein
MIDSPISGSFFSQLILHPYSLNFMFSEKVVVNKEVYMENSEAKGMCFEKVEEKQ